MTIYEIIERRRSVRDYKTEKSIPEDSMKRILEAARLAPSARNAQEYKLIVVKDLAKRKQLAKAAAGQRFIEDAPVVIIAVSLNPGAVSDNGVPSAPMDVAIALDHMSLAAVEEQMGTCWVCAFAQDEVKRILGVPEKYKVFALLTLGFPYDQPGVKSRKPLKQLVCEEGFAE